VHSTPYGCVSVERNVIEGVCMRKALRLLPILGLLPCLSLRTHAAQPFEVSEHQVRVSAGILERVIDLANGNLSTTHLRVDGHDLLAGPATEVSLTVTRAEPNGKPKGLKPGEGGTIDSVKTFNPYPGHHNDPATYDDAALGQTTRWVEPMRVGASQWANAFLLATPEVSTPAPDVARLTVRARARGMGVPPMSSTAVPAVNATDIHGRDAHATGTPNATDRVWEPTHGQDARATTGGAVMPTQPQAKTGFVYDGLYLEHQTTPGHPESPARLTAILDKLKTDGVYAQLTPLTPKAASLERIQTIHTPKYVERVRTRCETGEEYLDSMDVPISRKSYAAALLAAGGVLRAVDAVMGGEVINAFCAIRPPGHHALADRAMGFCIFNNVAIGTRYVQQQYRLSKVLIVDWDVHHGNGTQAAFYDDPTVLYFSTHQFPFYPGSGTESEKDRGKGLNHTINVPLPAGSGDKEYLAAFEQKLRPAALAFAPQFVFISAGFDAHEHDTLGGMRVTTECYGQLTRIVKGIADQCCQGRLVAVLEGGYGLPGLAASVETHIRVLMD
jgi:acetoin utilization deacetylase AcuC-like enzyme